VGEDSGCARSGINSYGENPGQKETQKGGGKKKKTPLDHCIHVLTSTCKVVTSTSTSKVVEAMY
jgi:hypothetical protein